MKYYASILAVAALAVLGASQAWASETMMGNPELPDEPEEVDGSNSVVPANVTFYDDTRFADQLYWDALTDDYRGRSEIEAVHKAFEGQDKEPVRVAVLDSGFYDSPDMDWKDGVNLSEEDDDKGIEIGDDFRQYDPDSCDTAHGQGVASIIGATQDNGFMLAGIADVELFGVRVLGCNGRGPLSDVAEGILWAAADPSHEGQGYPALDEPVDVMNISISGNSADCPSELQDAIDYANDEGVTIVVAAGNSNAETDSKTPANCDGVITTAAVDRSGDQADFTNHGGEIDIAAQGVDVVGSSGTDGEGRYRTSRWDGTSFASPIVAGLVAYIRSLSDNDDPDVDRDWVTASTTGFADTDDTLGPGVLNAPLMAESALGSNPDDDIKAEQILADPARCNNALFTDEAPVSLPACELYELRYDGIISIPDGYELMVFEGDSDDPLAAEQDNLVKGSEEATFVFQASSSSEKDYGVQVCTPDMSDCKGSLQSLDIATTIQCSDTEAVAEAKREAANL